MQPDNPKQLPSIQALQESLNDAEKRIGDKHVDLIPSIDAIAERHLNHQDYAQAESLLRRSLSLAEKEKVSPKHCLSLQKLAWLRHLQNQDTEAETLFMQSVNAALSTERDDLATQSMRALAYHYLSRDNYVKTEETLINLLKICQKQGTESNYQSAYFLVSLTAISRLQDKQTEAKVFSDQAAQIIKDKCASGYAVDYLSLAEIVNLYLNQGRLSEAKSVVATTLLENEDSYWSTNPVAGKTLAELAEFFRGQRKFKQAESVYKRAITIRESTTGISDPDFATLALNLANMYLALKKYGDAEPILKSAMKARVSSFGAEHPSVAGCVETYAHLLRKTKRNALANKLDLRAREIRSRCVAKLESQQG